MLPLIWEGLCCLNSVPCAFVFPAVALLTGNTQTHNKNFYFFTLELLSDGFVALNHSWHLILSNVLLQHRSCIPRLE